MRILFCILLGLLSNYSFGQKKSCCEAGATEQFGLLASDDRFANFHDAPLPFYFESLNGELISFQCTDSLIASAFEIRSSTPTNNWLIIVHEWWGLNDYIKQEAERLQKEIGKINVLAIDLYDGKVAETPVVAQQLLGSLKDERARSIIQGAINYTGKNSNIYTIGWCMGGGWAFQASLMAGNKSKACVFYYGMPESDISKLKKASGDFLGIFASKDSWISPEIRKTYEANMKLAKKAVFSKSYEAEHAFANPSNPKFDKVAAAEANKQAIDFLKKRLIVK